MLVRNGATGAHILLGEISNGTNALESNLSASKKVKCILTIHKIWKDMSLLYLGNFSVFMFYNMKQKEVGLPQREGKGSLRDLVC